MAHQPPSDRWYEALVRRTAGLDRDEEQRLVAALDAHRGVIVRDILGSRAGLRYLRELEAALASRRVDVRNVVEIEADARVEDARDECLARLGRIGRRAELGRAITAEMRRNLDADVRALGLRWAHIDAVIARMAVRPANAKALARLRVAADAAGRARARLVEAHLRLVTAIARRHLHRGLELSDLVQEGTIGLMRAIDRFDSRHQVTFATYAAWWVRQTIGRAIVNRGRFVRLPGGIEDGLRKLHRHRRLLTLSSGRTPTSAEIAVETQLPVARVEDLTQIEHQLCHAMVPFDDPSPDDPDGRAPVDLVAADGRLGPEDAAIARGLSTHASRALLALSPRERQVLQLRYGIGPNHEHTLEDIGRQFGLTRQRILQIASKALDKLRASHHARPLQSFWES